MRSGKGMEWWVVVSGMPEEHVETLQILKPQGNILSNYDYKPVGKYLGQGLKKYFTFTWSELSTGKRLLVHTFLLTLIFYI